MTLNGNILKCMSTKFNVMLLWSNILLCWVWLAWTSRQVKGLMSCGASYRGWGHPMKRGVVWNACLNRILNELTQRPFPVRETQWAWQFIVPSDLMAPPVNCVMHREAVQQTVVNSGRTKWLPISWVLLDCKVWRTHVALSTLWNIRVVLFLWAYFNSSKANNM